MQETHCPVCHTELEVREVAPCYECGGDPTELEDLAARRHTYAEVRALGVAIVLCDFCQADFSSYSPSYFNQPANARLGLGEFEFIRDVTDLRVGKDKFCPSCRRRLAFLRFVSDVRSYRPRQN